MQRSTWHLLNQPQKTAQGWVHVYTTLDLQFVTVQSVMDKIPASSLSHNKWIYEGLCTAQVKLPARGKVLSTLRMAVLWGLIRSCDLPLPSL